MPKEDRLSPWMPIMEKMQTGSTTSTARYTFTLPFVCNARIGCTSSTKMSTVSRRFLLFTLPPSIVPSSAKFIGISKTMGSSSATVFSPSVMEIPVSPRGR